MYLSSWSGGKDSCYACYLAMAQGLPVGHLVNFISQEFQRVSFHGVPAALVAAQAQAIGLPLLQKQTTPDGYEAEFKEAVRSLLQEADTVLPPSSALGGSGQRQGVQGIVFGDIHLEEHRAWVDRVCAELGLEVVEPLWDKHPEDILRAFIDTGFEAVVVSAQAHLIGREWVGRPVDGDFLSYLKSLGNVDLCGENGEYHTFVYDGPIFQRPLELEVGEVIERDGYYFLDVQGARLGENEI